MANENSIFKAELDALPEKYLTVQRWIRGKAGPSRKNYARYMILFNRITGKDPDQFLAWAKTVDSLEVQDLIDKIADGLEHSAARYNFKIEMRSFLRTNGFNNLPKSNISYTLQAWHRGYTRDEIKKIVGYLDEPLPKLYVTLAAESGLRARTVLGLRYRNIREDYEKGVTPVAIKLDPQYYQGKKAAGFTFLGSRAVSMLNDCFKLGLIRKEPEALLVPRSYSNIYKVVDRARVKAGIDEQVQLNHGLRKYFEGCLDEAKVDHEKKMVIEGHFAGVRAKHYTSREWDDLREEYRKAYPYVDVESGSPGLQQKLLGWEQEKRVLEKRLKEKDEELKNLQATTVSKSEFEAFETKVYKEVGILIGKEIRQRGVLQTPVRTENTSKSKRAIRQMEKSEN